MTGEGLSPAARALLDAARDGMAPDAAAIGRMRAKVASAAGTAAASTGAAIAFKLGIVAVVATLAAGAAIYGNRTRTVTPPQIELPATRSDVHAPIVQIRVDAPAVADASRATATIEMAPMHAGHAKAAPTHGSPAHGSSTHAAPMQAAPTHGASTHAAPTPAAPTRAEATVAAAPTGIDLAREVELVDLAMAALRRGDTAAALTAIRKHRSETRGAGQLAEDAAAIEIEALCRRHDPAVVAKLEAFDAKFPRSAQRSRLSTTCP